MAVEAAILRRKGFSLEVVSRLGNRLLPRPSIGSGPFSNLDSGYLFSGSRPASVTSGQKHSCSSDYFSLRSGSCALSPLPSPTPSVAGSATSSSGSLHHRRPLISPARLNLHVQKHAFSPALCDATQPYNSFEEPCVDCNSYPVEFSHIMAKNHSKMKILGEAGSVSSDTTQRKDSSSSSSACLVDTTTRFLDSPDSQDAEKLRMFDGAIQDLLDKEVLEPVPPAEMGHIQVTGVSSEEELESEDDKDINSSFSYEDS
ncbi:transmembrane protein 201-like [Rhinophrynus dorsalis]